MSYIKAAYYKLQSLVSENPKVATLVILIGGVVLGVYVVAGLVKG